MTARARVLGTLSRAPESRTLKHGGVCVTATVKAIDGAYTRFWHIVAISETAQAELMRLSDGDAVAVEGSLKAGLRDRNGETELFFGVIAERTLGLHPGGKKRTDEQPDNVHPPSDKTAPGQPGCAEGA
jgi:hypothetical protein